MCDNDELQERMCACVSIYIYHLTVQCWLTTADLYLISINRNRNYGVCNTPVPVKQ